MLAQYWRTKVEEQDFIITPEDAQLARRKRRIIVIGSLVIVLAVLFGVFGTRPTGHVIRAWQARRHAQKAFDFISKEQWSDARSEAMAAYQLSPGQPQALRAVARYLTRLHSIEALDFWKELSKKTSLTHLDVRDEAMIAIISGDIALADTAVRQLIDSHAEPADWLLAAQLAIQKNLPDEAKPYLEKIVADSRATESEQFRAALLQFALAGNNQTERANALTRLEKSAEGKTATSLDALVVLAQNTLSAPFDSSEAGRLASALENHPFAKAKHKLLAFDLRIHVDPTQRDQLIARAIADWKDSDPADRLDLARWLNSKGEYQRAIDSIPLEKAMQSSDLFLQHLDALAGLGRWNEVEQLLRSGQFPLEPFLEAMYLARCNSQLDEQTASANNWQRALEAAQSDARKLITLAQYAEKNENAEIAEAAYNGAAAAAPKLRVALACIAIGSIGGGSDSNRMRSSGPDSTGGGGGSSIPDVANNIWGGAIPGAGPAGSGTVASTSGSSMLNRGQQTGGTLALIDRTFLNDATPANKTVTAGNDANSGINSDAASASAGQVSGNGTDSSGTALTSGGSTVTTTIGEKSGGLRPLQVDALFSWTGATDTTWRTSTNWSPSGPPSGLDTAEFNSSFTNQPNVTLSTIIGTLHMTDSVAQNVTISSNAAAVLSIEGVGTPSTGILIDNTNAFTLTITARVGVDASQAWTNNSGNLFTVSGATLALGEENILTVNGTGNTLISSAISETGRGSGLTKDGSGTLIVTGNNTYTAGTTVNSGTLLVNVRGDLGSGNVTVNNGGTLGGNSIRPINRDVRGNGNVRITVAAGGNLAPGNGGNNTAVVTVNALTLEPASNFRIDINGTSPGAGYDRLVVRGSGNNRFVITNSNLVVSVGTTLSVGQTFLIGQRTSMGPISGEFAQGNSVVGSDGTVFSVSYTGGNGNDIVLTVTAAPVPEPSTWISGVLAIAGLAFTQRRRLRKVPILRDVFR